MRILKAIHVNSKGAKYTFTIKKIIIRDVNLNSILVRESQ